MCARALRTSRTVGKRAPDYSLYTMVKPTISGTRFRCRLILSHQKPYKFIYLLIFITLFLFTYIAPYFSFYYAVYPIKISIIVIYVVKDERETN